MPPSPLSAMPSLQILEVLVNVTVVRESECALFSFSRLDLVSV